MTRADQKSQAWQQLVQLYETAIEAAHPERAVKDGVAAMQPLLIRQPLRRTWILAVGKAAPAMARAALKYSQEIGLSVAGGLVVGVGPGTVSHPNFRILVGDHPIPGVRSHLAADAVGEFASTVGHDDNVIVLISGGTSSLIGAPLNGITQSDLAALHSRLLASGTPIEQTNAVRKRYSRWAAGRLAEALRHAFIFPIILSDVPSGDPAVIGSGPVSPDTSVAADKQAAEISDRVTEPFVITVHHALERVAAEAASMGMTRITVSPVLLTGSANAAGRYVAANILNAPPKTCLIWGSETTVRLPEDHGLGGRCLQMMLSAAQELSEWTIERPGRPWIMAAATDGQDGYAPTAGAIVNEKTWRSSAPRGTSPLTALERCDAYNALARHNWVLPARTTDTNVMDIVVAIKS